jgi:hypothetical protein
MNGNCEWSATTNERNIFWDRSMIATPRCGISIPTRTRADCFCGSGYHGFAKSAPRPWTLATTKQETRTRNTAVADPKVLEDHNVRAERALCECAHGCGLRHGSSDGRSQPPLSQIDGIERHNAFFGNNEEPCVSGNTNEIKHRFSMSSSSAIPACLLRTVLLFQLSCFERPLQGDFRS